MNAAGDVGWVGSHQLRVGDEIEVVGRTDRLVDARGAPRLRHAPEMTVLRASATRPLLIIIASQKQLAAAAQLSLTSGE